MEDLTKTKQEDKTPPAFCTIGDTWQIMDYAETKRDPKGLLVSVWKLESMMFKMFLALEYCVVVREERGSDGYKVLSLYIFRPKNLTRD